MDNSSLKVICYSGNTYAERPKSFEWHGKNYEVDKIEKSWREPGIRLFQVMTLDQKRFRLYYNETDKKWSITELVWS
jgi:hypothetical protein